MISFLPAIIWLILLLVLSSQNGPQTAATSLPMAEWIQQHFFPQDSVDGVHMYLRKWAHFIVYFIESGLLVLAMKNVMKAWKAACAVFGLCTILAIADEAHKVLIVGRHCDHGSVADLEYSMADSLGKGNTRRLEGIFSQEASYNDIRKTSCERGNRKVVLGYIVCFLGGLILGVVLMCLLQIKR